MAVAEKVKVLAAIARDWLSGDGPWIEEFDAGRLAELATEVAGEAAVIATGGSGECARVLMEKRVALDGPELGSRASRMALASSTPRPSRTN